MVHLLLNYIVFGHMILGTRYLSVFLLNLGTTDLGILVESMYVHTYSVWILFCLPRISTPSIRGLGKRLDTFRILLSSQRSLLQNASFATVAATEQNACKQHTHACFSFATKGFSPLSIGHAATSTWSVVVWLATDQAEVASHARCYWVLVPIDAWFCVTLFAVSEVEWKCILFRQLMSIFRVWPRNVVVGCFISCLITFLDKATRHHRKQVSRV